MEFEPMTTPGAASGPAAVPQPVAAPLTRAAIFLVVALNPGDDNRTAVRSLCADLAALVRAVGFREAAGNLSCVMAFGSDAWDRLFGPLRPAELHQFREFRADGRHAVATPGDLLFHIRAERMDLCFELATQIMTRLGRAVSPVDEVHGFRYFDARDLLGFVDGTENPMGQAVIDATLIGLEDAAFAGGSYVIVQKYLHDLAGWNALSTEAQERIIGRTKLSDIELDDTIKPTSAHSALTVIEEDGREIKILRDRPPGNYDRLLDFSRAVTGNLFFVPSATFLEEVTED
jgi:putative iron-dependent peroxidase